MTLAATAAPALQPELAEIKQQLLDARERARRLAESIDATHWGRRPGDDRWSIAECLVHLNVTSERFIPLIDDATRELRDRGLLATGQARRDLIGWLLCWHLEPPSRIRTDTPPTFMPQSAEPMADVLERFDYLQRELAVRLERASGLALERVKMISPFDARVKYNLYSAFTIILAHQRRHLFQAEQAGAELSKAAGARGRP
jgi:DinB superfamily